MSGGEEKGGSWSDEEEEDAEEDEWRAMKDDQMLLLFCCRNTGHVLTETNDRRFVEQCGEKENISLKSETGVFILLLRVNVLIKKN